MKYLLGTETFELSPNGEPGTWTYTLAGRTGVAQALEVEPGTYSILLEGRSYEVRVGRSADGEIWTQTAGLRSSVALRDPRNGGANGSGSQRSGVATIKAPMPGKVIRLLVSEGTAVEAGQGLVVVEAMKMQNEMKAPRAGVVKALKTKEGATVAAGETLLVLE